VADRIGRAATLAIAALSLALFATSPLYAEGERWYAGLGLRSSAAEATKLVGASPYILQLLKETPSRGKENGQ
jgi:hypothetical protein